MGALAFVDKRTGKGMMVKSVGGYQITSANTIHGRNGMFTRGLSSCFAVAVIGPGGTIFAHVSAYLGHPRLNSREQAELDAMKKGFAALYKTNKAALDPCTVAIVDGGYTDPSQRQSLMNLIFPQLHSVPHIVYFACEKTPLERHAGHGTVVVMLEPSNKLYVEDKPKL
ncbi:hypothetical protein C8A05DRAFT_34579 [Staphylotrichum tortipilum]|uniref:Uncharacterized protein n=1 Tax=Staphylotrichum tortipilum TaxID=2831512 RepID=A0AAN6MIY0_9PEZI|nr:hypothetical protein C8A05DRAFT_34579 [Staphylotrichum longicolle]